METRKERMVGKHRFVQKFPNEKQLIRKKTKIGQVEKKVFVEPVKTKPSGGVIATPTLKPSTSNANQPKGNVPLPASKPATSGANNNNKPAAVAAVKKIDTSALAKFLESGKISKDNAIKYAEALGKEGYDTPDKLALIDDADLTACGITTRFDVKAIMALRASAPKAVVEAVAGTLLLLYKKKKS